MLAWRLLIYSHVHLTGGGIAMLMNPGRIDVMRSWVVGNERNTSYDHDLGQDIYIIRTIKFLLRNLGEDIELEDLARNAKISKFNLCRAFHRQFKLSPMKWVWVFRGIVAAEFLVKKPHWHLTDIALMCGFTSSSHFSRFFKTLHGTSPSRFRALCRLQTGTPSIVRIQAPKEKIEVSYSLSYEKNSDVLDAAFRSLVQRFKRKEHNN